MADEPSRTKTVDIGAIASKSPQYLISAGVIWMAVTGSLPTSRADGDVLEYRVSRLEENHADILAKFEAYHTEQMRKLTELGTGLAVLQAEKGKP